MFGFAYEEAVTGFGRVSFQDMIVGYTYSMDSLAGDTGDVGPNDDQSRSTTSYSVTMFPGVPSSTSLRALDVGYKWIDPGRTRFVAYVGEDAFENEQSSLVVFAEDVRRLIPVTCNRQPNPDALLMTRFEKAFHGYSAALCELPTLAEDESRIISVMRVGRLDAFPYIVSETARVTDI